MSRERILLGGESGSGKSHSWLTIAVNEPTRKFYCIESDDGIRRLLEEPGFVDLKNIEVKTVQDWPSFRECVDEVAKRVKEGKLTANDFVIVEGIDMIFYWTRFEFIKGVYGHEGNKTSWETIMARRRTKAPVLEPSDHDGINMEWDSCLSILAYRIPCHFIATTGVASLDFSSKYEAQETKDMYQSMGMFMKFEGHKLNPRKFDTLITLSFNSRGYFFKIWRDRGNRGFTIETRGNERVNNNFWMDYLVRMAGWS